MENNQVNPELILLFPTPILKLQVPTTFLNIVPHLEELSEFFNYKEENIISFGRRSNNSYILDNENFKEFKNYLLTHIQNFAEQGLNLVPQSYRITQSWISHKEPSQHHHSHTHPNSIISGVFYWEKADLSLPSLYFQNPNNRNSGWSMEPLSKNTPHNITVDKTYIELEPGTLILFPSFLPHGVDQNSTNKVRKSLAFNSIPNDFLGDERSLTELKFN
jgi:uncharacterized protein (TIGR02466 family)